MTVDVNLTAQFVMIYFIISSSATTGGLSIGLTGTQILPEIDNQTLTQFPRIKALIVS